jgi:hypothetical protein
VGRSFGPGVGSFARDIIGRRGEKEEGCGWMGSRGEDEVVRRK